MGACRFAELTAANGGAGAGGTSGLTEELSEREMAHEQAFVDRVYLQLERSAKAARQLAREAMTAFLTRKSR